MWTELERAVARAAERRDLRMREHTSRRRSDGVVHTPPELARYGVRAAQAAARDALGLRYGLADPGVAVVDPACGPGAFVAAVLDGMTGPGPEVLVGIDRDPAALEQARALLGPVAADRGVPLTFSCADTLASLSPWPRELARDAAVAVIGNPPWAVGSGTDTPEAMGPLLEDFRRDGDGRPIAERRIGVLRDAYVRFWRWAAELAWHAGGGGVVVLVTNASFLSGPVHRGMRDALVRWFDGIDVLDLGGSALVAREGRRDENVFGVRPQVALTVAWRRAGGTGGARPRYARLWGSRQDKLSHLAGAEPDGAGWSEVLAPEPGAPFLPGDDTPWPPDHVSLAEAMPFHREGVQTNRDRIAVDVDRERLLDRLRAFARGEGRADLRGAYAALRHYDPERAQSVVQQALEADPEGRRGLAVRRVAYRPFDVRWLAPHVPLCHRPRPELARAVDRSEAVLLTVRKDRGERPWTHFGAASHAPDNCWLSTRSSCRTRAFPTHRPDGSPNLDDAVAEQLARRTGQSPTAGAFLRYALAVLAAPRYRATFDHGLRHDYPRVPLPADATTFGALLEAGDALLRAFLTPVAPGSTGWREQMVGHGWVRAPAALAGAIEEAEAAYVRQVAVTARGGHRLPALRRDAR